MRVLLISDFVPPVTGGLEIHVDALARDLARRGDQVALATLTRDARLSEPSVEIFPIRSAAHALPHEDRNRPFHPPLPEPLARHGLRRAIEAFQPDIVHGHSWLTVSLPRELPVPVVFTAHDYGLVCQLRTMMRPDVDVCDGPERAKCIACGTPTYGKVRSQLLTRGTIAGRRRFPADHIAAVSGAVQRVLAPYVDVPVRVLPNFVAAPPPEEPLPTTMPESFVLYAGDGRPYKGVPELRDVWRQARPSLPLVIASPRPPEGPLPSDVVSVSLTRGQMSAAWQRAALAVVPSRWADPCPTVVLEAMRAGVPVVGTFSGGIPELVRNGIDGELVAPRDSRALAATITELLADDARRRRMGDAARARSREFSVERITDKVRELYLDAIAQRTVSG